MRTRTVVGVLVLLAFCAGCLGVEPAPENPWENETVNVSVVESVDEDRDYAPMVKESIQYWNENMSTLGWEGEFEYVEDDDDPNVRVEIVDEIRECPQEGEKDLVGCAPYYNESGDALDQTDQPVEIVAGLNNSSTEDVATHEFGHTLGLEHSDNDEWPIMEEFIAVTTTPQPNATERANPFDRETITVAYRDSSTGKLNDYIRGEYNETWDYFNDGESKFVPSNVTFEPVDLENPSDATIEIRIVDDLDGGVSTVDLYGYDEDRDGAFETYERVVILIHEDVNQNDMAWHVGSWVSSLFAGDDSELPSELTTRSPEIRGRWPS